MPKKYKKRIIFFARIAVPYNIVMAVGKVALGIFSASAFLAVNALFNIGIATVKYFAVKVHNQTSGKNMAMSESDAKKKQNEFYMITGRVLFLSCVAYLVYCVRLFFGFSSMKYPMNFAIAIAAVTFTEIVISLQGTIKTRRDREPLMEAVKLTNFACALLSLVLTQGAIMSFATTQDMSFYNGLSGMIFGSIAALIGLYMVVRMAFILKKNEIVRIDELMKMEVVKNERKEENIL